MGGFVASDSFAANCARYAPWTSLRICCRTAGTSDSSGIISATVAYFFVAIFSFSAAIAA